MTVANWLFLVGSLIFIGEATAGLLTEISPQSIAELVSSLLFTTGSLVCVVASLPKQNQ